MDIEREVRVRVLENVKRPIARRHDLEVGVRAIVNHADDQLVAFAAPVERYIDTVPTARGELEVVVCWLDVNHIPSVANGGDAVAAAS